MDVPGPPSADSPSPTARSVAKWHRDRSRSILRDHPEVKRLIGPDRRTALVVVVLATLQVAIALGLGTAPWWAAIVVAYVVGIPVAHALAVSIHDLAHDLVFERRAHNKALSLLANMPLMFPGAIDFRAKHLAHHRHLGDDERDTQRPADREGHWANGSWLRKILWLTFGPVVFHAVEPDDVPSKRGTDPWIFANLALCVAPQPFLLWYSPSSYLYLFVASLFAFGPHPVGVRRYAEHVALREGQPTYSYYGPWNWLALNVGHHVEHHDFPGVPWTRLPTLRAIAREHYDSLVSVRSWTTLLFALFFDRRFGVDRYVRDGGPEPGPTIAVAPPRTGAPRRS